MKSAEVESGARDNETTGLLDNWTSEEEARRGEQGAKN
jgi:hypothetical protein